MKRLLAFSFMPPASFVVALAVFAYLFVSNAWIGDDAHITFRTVDNFVHGYGMRWNVHERVQVFTHPLWMLLCSAVYSLTREFYYSVLALSFAMCVAAFLVQWRSLPSSEVWRAGVFVLILTTSKTFMDFSSSGLENCLGALWACLFVAVSLNRRSPSAIRWAVLISAAAYVTRQDTVLLYLAGCIWLIVERRRESPNWKRDVILGLSPAIAWTVFSLVYFGFPFPNTAYGKALVAIPFDRRVEQGLRYFSAMAEWDIGGTLVIALAIAVSIWRRDAAVLVVGVVLHAVYVLLVGSSSSPMALRFFSISVVLSAGILLQTLKRWEVGALAVTATVIAVASPISPWRSAGCAWAFLNPTSSLYVLDTRAAVCRDGGALYNAQRHVWLRAGREFKTAPERVRLSGPYGTAAMGWFGLAAGPEKIIVDPLGVTDPLLARLPVRVEGYWIPGHLERPVPVGYLESLESGENRIAHPALHDYYDSLRLVTAGPLFSLSRWREIVALNLGRRQHLLDIYQRTGRRAGDASAPVRDD